MAKLRFKLCADDAKKFPEGDGWFNFDLDELYDLPSSELTELEVAMDYTVGELVDGFHRRSSQAMRAAVWIARRRAGVNEKFTNFDPRIWRISIEDLSEGVDVDPPAPGPEEVSLGS